MSTGPGARLRSRLDVGDGQLGVSTITLASGPQIRAQVEDFMRRWAQDRALSSSASERLRRSASAAVGHGLMVRPLRLTLSVRWIDLDRVRLEFRWHGCTSASSTSRDDDRAWTAALAALGTEAQSWGVRRAQETIQWMVLDSRP